MKRAEEKTFEKCNVLNGLGLLSAMDSAVHQGPLTPLCKVIEFSSRGDHELQLYTYV